MVKVSPNDTGQEDGPCVDLLSFRERATWNLQRFLTSKECL